MALSDQIAAYDDCYDLFDKAMAHPKGVRAQFEDYPTAHHFRLRMNHSRILLRRESKRIYEAADPRWNKSEYDGLVIRLREDEESKWWVYVERNGGQILAVETLDDVDSA